MPPAQEQCVMRALEYQGPFELRYTANEQFFYRYVSLWYEKQDEYKYPSLIRLKTIRDEDLSDWFINV